MSEKKYKVTEETALVVKGVVLKPGEAIPDGAVDAEAVKALVAAKKIVEIKDAPKDVDKDAKKAAGQDGKQQ